MKNALLFSILFFVVINLKSDDIIIYDCDDINKALFLCEQEKTQSMMGMECVQYAQLLGIIYGEKVMNICIRLCEKFPDTMPYFCFEI